MDAFTDEERRVLQEALDRFACIDPHQERHTEAGRLELVRRQAIARDLYWRTCQVYA